jgi:Ti-type conjugative transfer relaxase TraA
MAVYHLSVKNGAPGHGGAHAAYIERAGDYAERDDLQFAESGNLPKWAEHDALLFWQAADRFERANGRPFREIEIALPRELSAEQRIELVREFVDNTLGERHAYTWAIHTPVARDGKEQPHAHIIFSERVNDGIARDPEQYFRRWNAKHPELGGAGKDRYLSSRAFVREIRAEWAMTANQVLERHGHEVRIDHRSYKAQGIELEPQLKRGIATYATERGVLRGITAENRERAARNGERIIAQPAIAIEALTATQSVFSRRDLEQFVFRNSDSTVQYQAAMLNVLRSPELVALEKYDGDRRVGGWYTSQELHGVEQRLVERAQRLAQKTAAVLSDEAREHAVSGRHFNAGQREAFDLITGSAQLAVVNGAAGTGKSYVLSAMREAFEQDGYRVLGATLQGKTADDLQRDAGIESRTVHSLLAQIAKGELQLDRSTVLVVDEAGMVGSRQFETLLGYAEQTGARLRLVGDAWQLHAVDAGDAFREVAKQATAAGHTAALTEIMRQREDWQREASTAFAHHEIAEGLDAYQERGFVQAHRTQGEARAALLEQWQTDRQDAPQATQILLTHTNEQRQALNRLVRTIRREAGELGEDALVRAGSRTLRLAEGDRVMLTRNDYDLGVKNGSLGTLISVDGERLGLALDDGRSIRIDTRDYGHLDYGYALTIHKSQGVTVDRAYLLATASLNAPLTYVAMTRHREALHVAYSREHFKDEAELAKGLSRADHKDFSARYEPALALQLEPETSRTTLAQRQAEHGLPKAAPFVPEASRELADLDLSPAGEFRRQREALREQENDLGIGGLRQAVVAMKESGALEAFTESHARNLERQLELTQDRSRGLER